MPNESKSVISCYFVSEMQKSYVAERLRKEFGSSSRGMLAILTERYGTFYNPGRTRIVVEGNK